MYTAKQLHKLSELLAKGLDELFKLKQTASLSGIDLTRIELKGGLTDKWFQLLQYAKDQDVEEDLVIRLVNEALEQAPTNKYLKKAESYLEFCEMLQGELSALQGFQKQIPIVDESFIKSIVSNELEQVLKLQIKNFVSHEVLGKKKFITEDELLDYLKKLQPETKTLTAESSLALYAKKNELVNYATKKEIANQINNLAGSRLGKMSKGIVVILFFWMGFYLFTKQDELAKKLYLYATKKKFEELPKKFITIKNFKKETTELISKEISKDYVKNDILEKYVLRRELSGFPTKEEVKSLINKEFTNKEVLRKEDLKTDKDVLVLKKPYPSQWELALWEKCWNGKYLDFTKESWIKLSALEQNKLANDYQKWFAKRNGEYVEKTFSVAGTEIEMVLIPPGKYKQGSPETEEGSEKDEKQREVLISKAFWCGKYEVTQKQWEEVMKKKPSQFQGANNPVERVSWDDCQAYLGKLNEKEKKKYDKMKLFNLLREGQWEYACRSGTTRPFHFGENITTELVNYNGEYPYKKGKKGEYRKRTVKVGSFGSNGFGLYEMHGNVWEWCFDAYKENDEGDASNPVNIDSGSDRVIRGGSWLSYAKGCRSARRGRAVPDSRDRDFGFRLSRYYP